MGADLQNCDASEWLGDAFRLRDTAYSQEIEDKAGELLRQLLGDAAWKSWRALNCAEIEFELPDGTAYQARVFTYCVYTQRRKPAITTPKLWPWRHHCVAPRRATDMPYADSQLTMALRIKADPVGFFLVANPGL